MTVSFFKTLIKMYSYLVSPLLGRNCRHAPTCSCYAYQALDRHGAAKGLFLALRRILGCHPWSKGSYYDPVPERFAWRDIFRYKRSHSFIKEQKKD